MHSPALVPVTKAVLSSNDRYIVAIRPTEERGVGTWKAAEALALFWAYVT
mgnify:CR=1 FL=1